MTTASCLNGQALLRASWRERRKAVRPFVKHILTRLVLDSRVQIAAWVIERGLHQGAPIR